MKSTLIGKFPSSVSSGRVSFLSILLLAAGCAHNPDIRQGGDNFSGVTAKANADYIACIKDDIQGGIKTFTVEENGKTNLFIGSLDPDKASGLVELSGSAGEKRYSVHQRDAWYDKGRLIDAAMECSRA
ncbi:hypothetical protein [Pseudomonas fluorescens]|uniref:Lipoprotein n=1 Tax=Pseudomonas fluorescens TaxID=294 RepID=A0A5E7BCW7_PSEFL|nr:hypothetical protein [Pseudomonas fluorescens]VVN86374.1 hypothetical protein PS691_01505 [Pseudomonas fluorescens]